MTTFASAGNAKVREPGAWLALAAAPTFALMALVAAGDPAPMALCAAGPRLLPVDGMVAMYLLMSVFHLSPWLRLACRRPRLGA